MAQAAPCVRSPHRARTETDTLKANAMVTDAGYRLPRAYDQERCRHGLERWHVAADGANEPMLRQFCRSFAASRGGANWLAAVFGNSPFLSQVLIREQPFFRCLVETGPEISLQKLLTDLETQVVELPPGDSARLMPLLRIAKRRAALLIALADIGNIWSLDQVTSALSRTADTAVQLATRSLLGRIAQDCRLHGLHPDAPEAGSGAIVLAMGKLGAEELNYSSDIDLIVLYDDTVAKAVDRDTMQKTYVRFSRDLVRHLDERTIDGYVFRTDLRLRPDPGATPPAVSVSAAETYYGSVGQNWERAALIKARPIAGDAAASASFLSFLRPFIWRRNLDFAAIEDIHSIKRQINAHKGHSRLAVNGHDIKVGRGGIREIEFFVQTQQLIYGGREPRLRTRRTLNGLALLAETERIAPATATALTEAYGFLRRVEHRLQMIDDQQTQRLPTTDEGIEALAVFLGYEDGEAFRRDLLGHLERVEDHYGALFGSSPSLSGPGNLVFTGTDPDPATVETLTSLGYAEPVPIIATVANWHRGRYRATRSARSRELLTELAPTLLQSLAGTANPMLALRRFDEFLGRLPSGIQLFSLFYANPWLLDLVADIMGTAEPLALVLSRHPVLLDAVLSADFFTSLPSRETLEAECRTRLADARDFEDGMLAVRRWTNEHRFKAGVQILRGFTDADRCGGFLTDLASVGLAHLLSLVQADFAERHGRFPGAALSVLAMGKLGGRQLTIGSDLDLIVVYDVPSDRPASDGPKPLAPGEYHIRLTKRLITALTAPTADGKLYDVDMRLRPSGNAGPLAVSFESFARYQRQDAWTWEHMALTRARPLIGDAGLCVRLTHLVADVLTQPRDPDRLLSDVAHMRRLVDQEFGTDNPWNVKYARGGVMDINFITQTLMLRHAATHPHVLAPNTAHALAKLADAGLLDGERAVTLVETLRLWRRIQGFLRLVTETGVIEAGRVPPGIVTGLTRIIAPHADQPIDFSSLEAKVRSAADWAHAQYREIIEHPAERLPHGRPREMETQ